MKLARNSFLFLFLLQSICQAQPNPIAVKEAGDLTLEKSLHLRDPFRQPDLRRTDEELADTSELEELTVDQFKLVGVINGPEKNKALLQSPAGKMFILSENMRIGARNGVIRKITPKAVTVEEKVLNILGQEEKISTKLNLVSSSKKEPLTTFGSPQQQPFPQQNFGQPQSFIPVGPNGIEGRQTPLNLPQNSPQTFSKGISQ